MGVVSKLRLLSGFLPSILSERRINAIEFRVDPNSRSRALNGIQNHIYIFQVVCTDR